MHLKQEIRETDEDYVKVLFLSVKVFSTKVLIGDTISTSPTGDGNGTTILHGHLSQAKIQPLAV